MKSIEIPRWVVWDRLLTWKKRQPIRSWREPWIFRSSRFVDRAIRRTMEYWERRRIAVRIVYRSSEETLWSCGNGLSRWIRSWSLWRWCSVCMSICRTNRPKIHSHNKTTTHFVKIKNKLKDFRVVKLIFRVFF